MVLALGVGLATLLTLAMLRYAGATGNTIGWLVGVLGCPLLLIIFHIKNESRKGGRTFGDWRFLPSSPAMSVVAVAGCVAGAAHTWFFANEITRWMAG